MIPTWRDLAWLGWLPLTLLEFAGPGIALAGDGWLTVPAGRSVPRPAALRRRGHGARRGRRTRRAPRQRADGLHGPSWGCLVRRAALGRHRSPCWSLTTWRHTSTGSALPTWPWSRASTGSSRTARSWTLVRAARPAIRPCGAAVPGLCAICRRRSGAFICCSRRRSGSGSSILLWVAHDSSCVFPACLGSCSRTPDELHPDRRRNSGSLVDVPSCAGQAAADPPMPLLVVVLHGLRRVDLVPGSGVPRSVQDSGSSVTVSTPIIIPVPTALQSWSARSMFGLCPLKRARNASSGRPVSLAARLGPQPRRFSCACIRSASRRLAGSVGFFFIPVFPRFLMYLWSSAWPVRPC